MKIRLLAILTLLCCMFMSVPGHAAFPVKHITATTATATDTGTTLRQNIPSRALKQLKHAVTADGEHPYKKPGWPGILAFVCAVAALPFYATALIGGFAICALGAIIFGAIGLNKRKYRNNGLAIAGFVIGIGELIFVLVLAIVIAAFFFG